MKPKHLSELIERIVKESHRFMDDYIRHAGDWHDDLCSFVYYDQGVCNCDLKKNKREVEEFIRKALTLVSKETMKAVRVKSMAEKREFLKDKSGFIERRFVSMNTIKTGDIHFAYDDGHDACRAEQRRKEKEWQK